MSGSGSAAEDSAGIEETVILLRSAAVRAASAMGATPPEAEDIAQTAAARFLAAPRPIRSWRAWVRVVVARQLQRIREARERFVDECVSELELPGLAQDQPLEVRDEIRAALEGLSATDRELLFGTAFGFKHKELARRLRLPVGQIGVRMGRARSRAMAQLAALALRAQPD